MSYRVFYTNIPLPSGIQHPDYSKLIPCGESTEELAIAKAFSILAHGHVVWRIDGPNSYLKGREEIRQMYFATYGQWPSEAQ